MLTGWKYGSLDHLETSVPVQGLLLTHELHYSVPRETKCLFRQWFEVQSSMSFIPIQNHEENQDKGKFASFKALATLYSKIAFFWDTKPRQSDPILAF